MDLHPLNVTKEILSFFFEKNIYIEAINVFTPQFQNSNLFKENYLYIFGGRTLLSTNESQPSNT